MPSTPVWHQQQCVTHGHHCSLVSEPSLRLMLHAHCLKSIAAGLIAHVSCAGDSIARLLWRMKNGEVPLKHEPRVAVVLIGTEDLVSPGCADPNAAQKAAAQLRGLLVYMHRWVGLRRGSGVRLERAEDSGTVILKSRHLSRWQTREAGTSARSEHVGHAACSKAAALSELL